VAKIRLTGTQSSYR